MRRADGLEYRRSLLCECEQTRARLAPTRSTSPVGPHPLHGHPPGTSDHGAGAGCVGVREGVSAAVSFIERRSRRARSTAASARCRATTRKGKRASGPTPPVATTARATSTSRAKRRRRPLRRSAVPRSQRTFHRRRGSRDERAVSSQRLSPRHRQADPAAVARRLPDGERRPLTARDVKSKWRPTRRCRRGLRRRFYSDRA